MEGSTRRSGSASPRIDAGVLEELYSDHGREVLGLCRSIVRNDDDAQDALQSAFTRAYAALERDVDVADARPWLHRIARNEAISILRRRRHEAPADLDEGASPPLEAEVARREDVRQLRADLAELPPRQRTALLLRVVTGLGHAEIAARTGDSPSVVKHSIAEARNSLAERRLGREMPCADVRVVLAAGDRRAVRARRLQAHLRACDACRGQVARPARTRSLGALLAPLAPVRILAALHDATTLAAGAPGGGTARALVLAVTVAGAATVVSQQAAAPAAPHAAVSAAPHVAVSASHAPPAVPHVVRARRPVHAPPAAVRATPGATAAVAPASGRRRRGVRAHGTPPAHGRRRHLAPGRAAAASAPGATGRARGRDRGHASGARPGKHRGADPARHRHAARPDPPAHAAAAGAAHGNGAAHRAK